MTRVESLNFVTLFVERSRLRNIEVDITALVRHCQDVAPATVPQCRDVQTLQQFVQFPHQRTIFIIGHCYILAAYNAFFCGRLCVIDLFKYN